MKKFWPDYEFEYTHFLSEFITRMKDESGAEVTVKQGKETDRERWGINHVIYVLGKLASFTNETLSASELYPEFICKRPEEVIADKNFVFEK